MLFKQTSHSLSLNINLLAQVLLSYDASLEVRQRLALDLLCYVTKKNKEALIVASSCELSLSEEALLNEILDRLINKKEPLPYILGCVQFLDLELHVQTPVLIPRPETEFWVDELIQALPLDDSLNILDMCTGTGCIGLALAYSLPRAHVVAVDVEQACVHLAQENAIKNKLNERFTVKHSNLFEKLSGEKFDVIVSNPPYIPLGARSAMQQSVLAWEDEKALFSGEQGLHCIEQILAQAQLFLRGSKSYPVLVIEIDRTQGDAIFALAKKYNYLKVEIRKDQFDNDRTAYFWI